MHLGTQIVVQFTESRGGQYSQKKYWESVGIQTQRNIQNLRTRI